MLRRVVSAMERIAPLRLAEPWDNVGVILEPYKLRPDARRVLLTIDLTAAVVEEAVNSSTGVIVSYHPPIFRPLPSLTLGDTLQSSLLRCAYEGIAIYTPHTALDSVRNGVNDWLLSGLEAGGRHVSRNDIHIIKGEEKIGGSGRLATYNEPIAIEVLVSLIKSHLGQPTVQIAKPAAPLQRKIKTVAICAGSGGSVFKGVDADVYWTGEMSHHEILAAVSHGRYVVLCGHTNTERGYLSKLRSTLQASLQEEDAAGLMEVAISEMDKHPLQIS